MKRNRNDGLRKRCDCPRRAWAKCSHPWHFNFEWNDEPYRFSLDRLVGKLVKDASGKWRRDRATLGDPITSKTDAERERDRLRTLICAGTFTTAAPVRQTLTLGQLFDTFVREKLKVRPGGTRSNDLSAINAITTAVLTLPTGEPRPFGEWLVVDITTAALEQFRTVRSVPVAVVRKGRGARRIGGPVGVNRLLGFVRRVFNWAILAGYMETTPFKRGTVTAVKLSRELRRTRRLQDGEEAPLLAACGAHLRAVVECALQTGMRRGEILGLRWADVQAGEIRLSAAMTKTRTGSHDPNLDALGGHPGDAPE